MKKTIYICDRCNGETKKKFLYNVNITFKNSKSNTFLTTIKKDICLKCIKLLLSNSVITEYIVAMD